MLAWGRNNAGQANVPTSISNAVSIAAGDNHSLALLSDGTIVGWGNNGDSRITGGSHLTNAVAIAAGDRHSLALLSDGTVFGWGWDWYGHSSGAAAISNATAVSAGHWHSTALHSDGTVSAWGYDYQGQCSGAASVQGAVSIDAGIYHSVAVRADGSVVAWGGNTYGERDVLVGLRNVKQVSASGYFSLALSGALDPLDYDSDNDGLLDGYDLTVNSIDARYDDFASFGIAYTNIGSDRMFYGELDAGTDPFNWQSSGSGILDGWAVEHGLAPIDPAIRDQDSDSDGVTNYWEMIYGTDPNASDSDGDGVSDHIEIMSGSNPLDSSETSNEFGATTFLLSAGYETPTGTGTGSGIGVLHIGTLSIPFSYESPLEDMELQLPRGVIHEMSFEGATNYLGGALSLSFNPDPNPMVIHDPEGLFGMAHDNSCGYTNAFVAFPIVYLTDTDIGIYWEEDHHLIADLVPDGLHGVYNYTVPEGYTASPASSTDGHTYISLDYPPWEPAYESLSVNFFASSNCLTTSGEIEATASIHSYDILEVSIEAENDPGHYLGVGQTNTYNAVLNMDVEGEYHWSVDTNYLEIVGSDTGVSIEVKAVAPGFANIQLGFNPDGASEQTVNYEIAVVKVNGITVYDSFVDVSHPFPSNPKYFAALKQSGEYGIIEAIIEPNILPGNLPSDFIIWAGGEEVSTNQLLRKISLSGTAKHTINVSCSGTSSTTGIVYVIWCEGSGFKPQESGETWETNNFHFLDNDADEHLEEGAGPEPTDPITGETRNWCEIQFTVFPNEMIEDGVNNLFDTAKINFDVRRDKKSYYWWSTNENFYVRESHFQHNPDTWLSDDTAGHVEEDNDPWNVNLAGHLYSADYPGFIANWYTPDIYSGGSSYDGGVQKLNMREWVRCVLGGDSAETILPIMLTDAETDGTLASDAYTWHSFVCVISNTSGFVRSPSNICENVIATNNVFWGTTPTW